MQYLLDLSAAVDVYSDWIDACDAVAKEAAGLSPEEVPQSRAALTNRGGSGYLGSQGDSHALQSVEDQHDGEDLD